MKTNTYRIVSIVLAVVALLLLVLPLNVNAAMPSLEINNRLPARGETKEATVFPTQLYCIDDEAFAETSIEVAVFNNNLVFIGERIFRDASELTDVYIPKKTEHIGENAFPYGTMIHVIDNSYAQEWAKRNDYEFIAEEPWYATKSLAGVYLQHLMSLGLILIPDDKKQNMILRRCKSVFQKSMRPQDRSELAPIDYRFP